MTVTEKETSGGTATGEGHTELKRAIGPGLLLLFIVGDILGTGVYALTGKVAKEVGGAVWLPFLCAFVVALITAFSYLELVTKYPRAGGAAVYTNKAFKVHFLTFLVCFAVMCSGLTSASSASKAFSSNLAKAAGLDWKSGDVGLLLFALGFMTLVAALNLRGVSESVKANVVLTVVELSGLLIIIGIGLFAIASGKGETGHLTEITIKAGESPFAAITSATALAFFAMVGFEDSVNMAEETKNPVKTFPTMMLIGLCITGLIYVLVAISSVALVPTKELGEGDAPLLKVIEAGAPRFPVGIFAVITMFAVANSALINMLMASRLLYGMARERVLPPVLGRILGGRRTPWVAIVFTTLLSFGLIFFADLQALGGTTSFILLVVFTIVNIAVLVLRKDRVGHEHFKAPTILPILGAILCGFLASPLSGRDVRDFTIGAWLLLVGIVLWAITFVYRKVTRQDKVTLAEWEDDGSPEFYDDMLTRGPHN